MIYSHGVVCSCVGPVIDVSFFRPSTRCELTKFGVSDSCERAMLPSVYDCILVSRSNIILRDGVILQSFHNTCFSSTSSSTPAFTPAAFFYAIPLNDVLSMSLTNLLPFDYHFSFSIGILDSASTTTV
jgi:hypothetical protein